MTVLCRRRKDHPTHGTGRERKDKHGAPYWVFYLGERRTGGATAPTRSHTEGKANPATAEERDHLYRRLLRELTGGKAVGEFFDRRAVPESSPLRKRYRRYPLAGRAALAGKLAAGGLEPLMARTPGFFVKAGDRGDYWTLAGRPGIAVPVTDAGRRVSGILLRPDQPGDGGKYLWLSSGKHGGAKARPAPHVPHWEGDADTARLTEGVVKADVATELGRMLCVGLPGLYSRDLGKTFRRLGVRTVRLCFDADARGNPNVAGAVEAHHKRLTAEGFVVELERWDAHDGKGIDDLLAAGKQPELMTGPAVAEAIGELTRAASLNPPSNDPAALRPGEEWNDPHRLGRTFDAKHRDGATGERTLIGFRAEYLTWAGGGYTPKPDADLAAEVAAHARKQFEDDYPVRLDTSRQQRK